MSEHGYFLHKKSLLDKFKDDHKHTGYIQSARAEHTWNNPLTRRKRTKELNGWIKSFAGKRHIRKLSRFNALNAGRNEGMTRTGNNLTIRVHERIEPTNRVRYSLQDVADTVKKAFESIDNAYFKVTVYNGHAPEGTEYGMVVARNINSRYPYKWVFSNDLLVRVRDFSGNEVAFYKAEDLQDLYELIVEEYEKTL